MSYEKINFLDLPEEETPLDAANLNHMDEGIYQAHNLLSNRVNVLLEDEAADFSFNKYGSLAYMGSLLFRCALKKTFFVYTGVHVESGTSHPISTVSQFTGGTALTQENVAPFINAETGTKKLVAVHVGSDISIIRENAFSNALNLENVYIHNSFEKISIVDGAFNNGVNINYEEISAEFVDILSGCCDAVNVLTSTDILGSMFSDGVVCIDYDSEFYVNPQTPPSNLVAVLVPKTYPTVDISVYENYWQTLPGSGQKLRCIIINNSPEQVEIYSGEFPAVDNSYIYFTMMSQHYLSSLESRIAALENQEG
jgi:hypothetical protein